MDAGPTERQDKGPPPSPGPAALALAGAGLLGATGRKFGSAVWRAASRYPFAALIIGGTVVVTAIYHSRSRRPAYLR